MSTLANLEGMVLSPLFFKLTPKFGKMGRLARYLSEYWHRQALNVTALALMADL